MEKINRNIDNDNFDIERTNYCKGIAIIILIIHHLFWDQPGIGLMIGNVSIFQRMGIIGKVCVSIFLILSGLGLNKKNYNMNFKDKKDIVSFYKKGLGKLYKNYIFIVITSVIVSMIFFEEKFAIMVGTGLHRLLLVILNLTGMQYLIGYQGLNGAWWFMSAIIICYILFPWINERIKKYGFKFLIIMFIISFADFIDIQNFKLLNIISWVFPFVLGVYISQYKILLWIENKFSEKTIFYNRFTLFLILVMAFFIRQTMPSQSSLGIKFDSIFSILIIFNVHVYWNKVKKLKNIFCYLGKKSMDIYYVHMFICTYYLSNFIYGLKSGILMILVVISLSLVYSYLLDLMRFIKNKLVFFIKRLYKQYQIN